MKRPRIPPPDAVPVTAAVVASDMEAEWLVEGAARKTHADRLRAQGMLEAATEYDLMAEQAFALAAILRGSR